MLHVILMRLLRPFRRWWYGPPDAAEAARDILDRMLRRAFRCFRNEQFRHAMGFNELPEQEHDFIFNELVASSVVLPMLMVESISTFTEPGVGRDLYRDLRAAFEAEYAAMLERFGVPKKHQRQWRKLIDVKLREFTDTRLEHRDRFPEIGEGNPWPLVCTITCLYHVRHGKKIEKDPALPLLATLFTACTRDAMNILAHHTYRA